MANRNLKVNMEVTADIKQAKKEMDQLIKTLGAIKTDYPITLKSDSLKNVSREAEQVQLALEKAFNFDTGKLDLSKFSQSLKESDINLKQLYNDFEATGRNGSAAIQQLSRQIALAETPVLSLNSKMKEFAGTLANTFRWQMSSSFLHTAIGSIQSAINYAKELNGSLTSIQIVTQKSDEEMSKFAESANRAAKELSTTTNRYAQASLIYYQQGFNAEEVEKRAAITVKMANVTGQTAEEVSQQMTAVWNNFYDGSKSLESYADGMAALGAATATSSAEIAQGLQKFSSIGQTVGLSYEYAASALATITATTRESADTVGNALRTLFVRIQGLNLGETADDGTTLNKYSAALAKVGINIKDANGQLKDMDRILDELGARWQTLQRDQQVALAQTVAGQRQYAQLMTLMSNWDFMKENLQTVASSSGTLQKQADIYAKSWEAASTRVRASLEEIYTELVKDDFFIGLADTANGFINILANVIRGMGEFKGILLLISSIVLDKYSKEMPNFIQSLTNTFGLISGSAQESARQLQEENKSFLDTYHNRDGYIEFQIEKTKILGNIKSELLAKEKELSDAEKIHYEMQISNLSKSLDLLDEQKQAVIELEKAKNEAKSKVDKAGSFLNSSDIKDQEGTIKIDNVDYTYNIKIARDEIIKLSQDIAKAQGTLNNFTTDFWGLKWESPTYIEDTIKLFEELDQQGALVPGALDKVTQALKESKGNADEFSERINIMLESLFKVGDSNLEDATVRLEQQLKNLESTTGPNADKAKALAAALREYQKAAEESGIRTADFAKMLLNAQQNMDTDIKHSEKLAESWSKVFSNTSAIAMSLTSLGSVIDRISNPDTTGLDKFITSLSSLPMLMRGISSVKDLGVELSGIFTGLSAGVATGITGGITALLAVVTVINKIKQAHQEALEASAKHAKEVADEWADTVKSKEEEYKNNRDLISQYKDLLKNYEETHEGKADLLAVGEKLAEAYDVEINKIDILKGKYEDFLDVILETNKKRQDELLLQEKAALNASSTAIEKEIATNSNFKTSSQFNSENNGTLLNAIQAQGAENAIIGILNSSSEALMSQLNFNGLISPVTKDDRDKLIKVIEDVLGLNEEDIAEFEKDTSKFQDRIIDNIASIERALRQDIEQVNTVLELSTGDLAQDGVLLEKFFGELAKHFEEGAYSFDEASQKITFNFDENNFEESLYNTVQGIQDIIDSLGADIDFSKSPFYESLQNLFSDDLVALVTQWNEHFSNIQIGTVFSKAQEILAARKEEISSFKEYQEFVDQVVASLADSDIAKGDESKLKSLVEEALEGTGFIDEAYSGNYKALIALAEKTGVEAKKIEEKLYNDLSDTAKEYFSSLDVETAIDVLFKVGTDEDTANEVKQLLNDEAEQIKKAAEEDAKSGTIAEALASLENITLTKTSSAKTVLKLRDALNWGEDGLISWDQFAMKDRDAQIKYLAQAKTMFEEVNKNNIEESIKTKTSFKETLESLSEIAESHGLEDLFSDSIAALEDEITELEKERDLLATIEEESAKSIVQSISTAKMEIGNTLDADQVKALKYLGIDLTEFVQELDDGSAVIVDNVDKFVEKLESKKLDILQSTSGVIDITKLSSYSQVKTLSKTNELFDDEEYEAAVKFLYATGQLNLSINDLNDKKLQGVFDPETWNKIVAGVDLSEEKTEDLLEQLKNTEAGEAFKRLLDEILGRKDLTTVQTIEAIIDALKKGVYSADEFINKTKEYLTAQEQLAELRGRETTDKDFSGYSSLAGNEDLSFEERSQAIEGMVESIDKLKESGKHASEEMKELYDRQLALLESDDSGFTMVENLEELANALEKGTLDFEHYEEGIKKILESERDWSMSEDAVIAALMDLEIAANKANGTLEKNAKIIGENCESMEDYEVLVSSLEENEASSEATKRATASALLKLAKNYDECKDEMHKYEAALRSGDQELQKSTKSALEFSIRCSEIAKNTGKTQDEIKSLAQSYKDLYQTVDESGKIMDISDEVAADLAERYININEGIKDLQQNWESYNEVLDALQQGMDPTNAMTMNDVFVDQAENLEKLREAMAQVLNMTDASAISNEFLAMNADLVTRAMEGEASAVEELQIRMAEKLMLEVGIDDSQFREIANSVGKTCDDIRGWLTTLPEGQLSLDNMQFLQALIDAMVAAGMTKEDIENKLSGIGFDLDLEPYNQDLQDMVDNADTTGSALATIAGKTAKTTVEAGSIDSEATIESRPYNETQQGIDWEQVEDPKSVRGSIVIPTISEITGVGNVISGFQTKFYEQVYPGIKVQPIVKNGVAQKTATGVGLKLKSGSYSKGGNISFKNSSGGNKPATTTTSSSSAPRSSSSGSTSAPRPTTVSGGAISPIAQTVHEALDVDKFSMEDYRQKKVQKDLPNYEEYDEEVYTTRKKYYNERYNKHKTFDEPEYQTKDESNFLVLSDEIDLYYDETHALEKLSAQLQEIETRKSRAFGKAHLDAIAEEKANIEQTIETQQAYLDKLGARGEELQRILSEQGFTFSDDGRITNNEEVITDQVLKTNLGIERMIEKSNELETDTVNALNEATDEWNKGDDAITDFANEASNKAYNRANKRLEHIDNVENSKNKQIKDRINEALGDTAEGKYDRQTAAQNTYEDIVEEAGKKRDKLLDEIVKERDEALSAEDEIKEMRLDSAKEEYLRFKNMYEGTYTDSDMAELARSELSEAKTKYDNLVKEIEQDAETAYKKINNKAEARIKKVEKDFTETEKIAKNVMEQSKDDAEYMSDVSIQNAKHVQAVSERNLKNWINREKRAVDEELDETTHEIQNAEADLRETNDARFEERTKEIEKTREQRQDLIDLEMDSIKDSYDKVIEQRDEFDQVSKQYDEVAQQIQENKNRLYDLNLEEIDYTLELKVRLSDEVVKALDSLLDSLGDFADKAADKIAILGSKMYQFAVQTNATRDAVRDLLNSTNLVDDAVVARFMTGSYTEDDLQALFNVDQFTSDKVAQLEGYRDQLISLISEQRNLKNEMFDTVMTAFNEYQEKLDLQIEKISTLTKFTETYRNIVGIVGKKVLDASGELSEKLARNAFDTQRSQTKVYKTILDELDSNIADMKYKQRSYDLDSEMYRDFQQRIDEMEAKRRQAQENWLSSWQAEMQAAADYYADAIDTITMVLDRSVSGLMDSLELLRQEYDRQKQISEVYIEDYEKIYQLNKLNRQVEAAIDDSEHIKNKQRLKKLQEEINNANQDGVKLSQYDLDVLQKKFELEMARSELEEATNAKSQVRMMRDAEGNYGFVYTADANAVADAEQNYEDKLHELQVLNTDYIKQLEENYLQLQQNVRDQLANLDITQFATEEEYLAEVNRIQQAALELQDRYGQQMTNATNNNQDLYNNDWKTYSEMTGYKISADKDYLDKFQETQTAVLTGFKSMEEQHQIFADSIAKATSSMIEAYRATQEMQKLAMQDGDTSMDNFASDAAKTIDKVGTQTEQLADEAVKLSEQFRDSFSDIADNAKNFADNYVKNIQPAIDASQKLLTTISDIISHQADLGGIAASTSGGSGGLNSGTTSSGTKNWNATQTEASLINAKSDIGEYLPFIGAVLQYSGYDTDYNGWGNSDTRKDRLEKVFGVGAVDDINKWMSEHAGEDSKNYYVAIADKLDKYSYETLGRMLGAFDTGGYTGSWGSSGRLAMLHEKELVLNKEDTSNILGAVDMVRNIAQVIDLNARATNQAMSTAFNAASVSSGNQVFEQQVTINADFPNATDRDEIIAAFDNLTNLAMQYAGRA